MNKFLQGCMILMAAACGDDPSDSDPAVDYDFSGDYVGTWTDGIGTFQLSLRIDSGDSTGKIWYSSGFSSCCGGGSSEDATFTMSVSGTSVTSFMMTQYLVDYPQGTGGHCPTTASTTGSFVSNRTVLRFDPFFFSDCDGARTVTSFQLTKQAANQ